MAYTEVNSIRFKKYSALTETSHLLLFPESTHTDLQNLVTGRKLGNQSSCSSLSSVTEAQRGHMSYPKLYPGQGYYRKSYSQDSEQKKSKRGFKPACGARGANRNEGFGAWASGHVNAVSKLFQLPNTLRQISLPQLPPHSRFKPPTQKLHT